MKIVKCSVCGKYFHISPKCIYCGNKMGFKEISSKKVHENVQQEFMRLDTLLKEGNFDDVISLSYSILEWMPNCAEVFWMRLLAKKRCCEPIDLITKGFSCDDPDFCNALACSVGEEHTAYEELKTTIIRIRELVKKAIVHHEISCKKETDILKINSTMQSEINSRKEKLFSLWLDLNEIEHSLHTLEMDGRLLISEHQKTIRDASTSASAIKSETSQKKECTAEELHAFRTRLESLIYLSDYAKKELETMRIDNPLVITFNELLAKRDEKVKRIQSEIEELKNYEENIHYKIIKIERIELYHRAAYIAAEKYDFVDAIKLLGINVYNQVLLTAGIGIGVSEVLKTEYENEKLDNYDKQIVNDDFSPFDSKRFLENIIDTLHLNKSQPQNRVNKSSPIKQTNEVCLENNDDDSTFETYRFGKLDWYILSRATDRMVLLSKESVIKKEFGSSSKAVAWRDSPIRKWLNESFYKEFNAKDRARIIKTCCINDTSYDTEDYIYLLSKNDAESCNSNNLRFNCFWWLRTAESSTSVSVVSPEGKIMSSGPSSRLAIRPVITIKR